MVWFRDYKIPDGKPPNAFGYDSKPMNSEFAEMVIAGTHNLCAPCAGRNQAGCRACPWHPSCVLPHVRQALLCSLPPPVTPCVLLQDAAGLSG